MKKRLVTILSILFMVLAVTACGDKTPAPEDLPEDDPMLVDLPTYTPTPTPTATDTPTPTNTPTPTPSPLPQVVTDKTANTVVYLSEYKGIPLTSVSDEAVNEKVLTVMQDYIKLEKVDRPAELGDSVLIYYMAYINNLPYTDFSYLKDGGFDLLLGSGVFLEGFEEHLVGASAGDRVSFTLHMPSDYPDENMRDKDVDFKITLNQVSEYIFPVLNDDFAKTAFGFDTVSDYFSSVRNEMNLNAYKSQITDYLYKNIRIDDPNAEEIKAEADEMYDFYYNDAYAYAQFLGVDVDMVIQVYYGVPSANDLRLVSNVAAEHNLHFKNCCKAISVYEDISLSDEEFFKWANENLSAFNCEDLSVLLEKYSQEYLRTEALIDKVYSFLLENAEIL